MERDDSFNPCLLIVEMERNPTITLPLSTYPHLSDAQLVELTKLGMTPAYDQLIERYRHAVCMTAARYVTPESAKDIAQEVFLRAYHALPQLEDPARFGAWLRTITRHYAERRGRRESREQVTLPEISIRNYRGPEEECMERERRIRFRQAIDNLSEAHREVILLRYVEEWSLAQIAEFLTVSEDVIRGRLYRARIALRPALTEERI